MKQKPIPCPCGLPARFDRCCGPIIQGETRATTPEALMRSRFSAFAIEATDWLLSSWHASTRPASLKMEDNPRWIGLKIVRTGSTGPDTGIVEFIARYRVGGKAHALHEISRFVREDDRWYYVDGDIQDD